MDYGVEYRLQGVLYLQPVESEFAAWKFIDALESKSILVVRILKNGETV